MKAISNSNQNSTNSLKPSYRILAVDTEIGIMDSLSLILTKLGYDFVGVTNPVEALEELKSSHFDILLLNSSMTPLYGDRVIEEFRKINKDIYILLLVERSKQTPPLQALKELDIQGFCQKSGNLDQIVLLIESAVKSIYQMREIQKVNKKLLATYNKLEKAYLESIQIIRYTVEAKDTYTRGHSDRVSLYSVLIGKKLGLSKEDIRMLKLGGLFHDVGKIGIPDNILQKKAKLTNSQYNQIKNHPIIGAQILSAASIFKDIIPIVKYHHERFDGTGYPDNLKGEDIPYLARITAVADSFDAMNSKRVYRNSLSIADIAKEFENNKGTQFDSKIVDAFLDILKNDYNSILKIEEKYK